MDTTTITEPVFAQGLLPRTRRESARELTGQPLSGFLGSE